jgi:hypothetical protein
MRKKSPSPETFYSVQKITGFRLLFSEQTERGSSKEYLVTLNASLRFCSEEKTGKYR